MIDATTHTSHTQAHPFGMVGDSPALHQLLVQIRRIGPHFRTVLLRGERGTGKDLTARAMHTLAVGPHKPFLTVDSAEMNAANAVSLGSLTSAAGGGTLYLDEVDELALPLQAELLCGLRERETQRGARTAMRLIASSSRDLRSHCAAGMFRQDLFTHLSMIEIVIPTLRQRGDDVLPLANHFAGIAAQELMLAPPTFSETAVARLQEYSWPGNVRELECVVVNAVARSLNGTIHCSDLALPEAANDAPNISREKLDDVVQRHVRAVLNDCAGNKLRAAEVLGISRSTLYRMLDIRGGATAAMQH